MLTWSAAAQVMDDFSDGDFSQGTPWVGDSGQFIVDQGELRLFSVGSDSSFMVTGFQPGTDTLEWRFRLRMTFSPSSQNYARYYLWSDISNLEGPLNAYYLQFGETGSADAFEFRYQSGWSSTALLRGPDSLIANGVDIRLKVVRFPGGFWQVAYDPAGGEQFVVCGTAFHPVLPVNTVLGLKCVYTSSNAQKFYLDDVYAGPYQFDRDPPELTGTHFIGSSGLGLAWNEPLNLQNAVDPSLFRIDSLGPPDSIFSLSADGRLLALYFPAAFEDTVSYTLRIHGVEDVSGNAISDTLKWSVFRLFPAEPGQIVFSEIMANPSGAPMLPPYEYVELHNQSSKVLTLAGCALQDAVSSCPLTGDTVKPGEYIVYTSGMAAEAFHAAGFSRCIGLSCFPSLNNDGDSVRITGAQGQYIDAVDYDNSMYVDPLRDDQGWSLERIDPGSPCSDRTNWKASVDPRGGTPGLPNSVQGIFRDTTAPLLLHAFPKDSSTILLYFDEWPDTTMAKDSVMYRLEPVGWTASGVQIGRGKPHVEITWPQALSDGTVYELMVDSRLGDCSGNTIDRSGSLLVGLPVPVNYGDVVINEVLFNPYEEDGDFVEIMNRSSHAIDVSDIRLASANPADGIVNNAVALQSEPRLLMPGEFLVAAVAPERIAQRYPVNGKSNMIRTDLSGYDDDEGVVILLDASYRLLDKFQYSDDFHFPLLADPEGVSLERIRVGGATSDKTNWHSASSHCGYATPGLKNSQQLDTVSGQEEWFGLDPALFSPDNDGYHDVLQMSAQLSRPGYMGSINIYNEHGWLIRQIAGNEYLGPEANWTWNGTNDNGDLMSPGPYIVSARFIHIDGAVRRINRVCVLAPARNSD